MSIEFAIISIVVMTCLMILAMLIRAKNRGNTMYCAIDFCHEGDCWCATIRMARFWRILYTRVRVVPGDLLSFRPQVAYIVQKNNRRIAALPNFWADSTGLAFCKIAQGDCLMIQIEVVLKDLAMARAFEKRLQEAGHRATVVHNKVVFKILSAKNHNCNDQ